MDGTSKKNDRGSQIKWTDKMDGCLINALIHQQQAGNRINGQWTTSSYDIMVKELREKLELPLKKEHLQNRQKTLKKNFNEAYDMFKNSSGFGGDEESKLFSAEPEVWQALIEAKPEAKKWMTTPIPYYEKLVELYAKDRANGEASLTAKERARKRNVTEQDSPPSNIEDIDEMVSRNEITLESNGTTTPVSSNLPTSSATIKDDNKAENSSKGKKRKGSLDEEHEIQILKDGLDRVAEAIREGNTILKHIRPRVYSSEEIFQELLNIEVEESKLFKAYRFLNANETRVREFFGCPQTLRKAFLSQMMEED